MPKKRTVGEKLPASEREANDVNDQSIADDLHSAESSFQDPPKKKRKLHTWEKAQLAYDKIQQDKEQRRQEREKAQKERELAMQKYQQDRRKKQKYLYKKTKRGQPRLNQQMFYLLDKIERNIANDKAGK